MKPVTSLRLKNFTAFEDLDFRPSEGINVLVGSNGTGKTHVMKLIYSLLSYTHFGKQVEEKILGVFLPTPMNLGRLVRRRRGVDNTEVKLTLADKLTVDIEWNSRSKEKAYRKNPIIALALKRKPESVIYIPVKEMLANAPGFQSLFATHEINFEEVYNDIIIHAFRPPRRGVPDDRRKALLDTLRKQMKGVVIKKEETFFLKTSGEGIIEFPLVAEGWRKLGLLWLLIQNQTLSKGSFLFWDEPESNLNPELQRTIANVLLELQRFGVQIFIATHDYTILKWFQLLHEKSDKIRYHAFERIEKNVVVNTTEDYFQIKPNKIAEAFDILYDEAIKKERGTKNK
ncbi:AAA family ATPase [bacterium]|nr:AAA family ATPase [bacterium]MBU1636796.1 AAA family ATPase [bacterium]